MPEDIRLSVGADTRPLAREIDKVRKKGLKLDMGGMSNFKNPLGKISGQMGEFEKSLEASNARVLAFGASAGALLAVQQGLQAIVNSSIEVEKSLADINVILNVSSKTLNAFSKDLFSVARNTGQSFEAVAEAATELSRQGLSVEETLKRTQDALILTRLSGLKAAQSVEAVTAALNSFSQAALESGEFVSKLAAVDAAFAVSSGDLAKAIQRVGSSAQEAGVSLDQLIAIVTSAQQITARGGAVIGNSFKTIFTRIQRPRVLKELENLGIATTDIAGNTRPAISILSELAKTFDTLSSSQRAQISELVGGVFQVNVLKASLRDLGKEFSLYNNALEISATATDEAARRNEELNKTVATTLNETIQNFKQFGSQAGSLAFGPAIENVLGGVNTALQDFDLNEAESLGEKISAGVLGGIGRFLSGPGLLVGAVTLVKVFSRLGGQLTDAFKTISGLGAASRQQADLQAKILQTLQANPQILDQIQNGTLDVAQAHKLILDGINKESQALARQVGIVKQLATLLSASGAQVTTVLGGGKAMAPKGVELASSGFIPNFASREKTLREMELNSASYATPSTRAVRDNIAGVGSVIRNTKEEKVNVPGLKQPFINPPRSSSEGKLHRANSIKQTGIDPYLLSDGFIPNFAEGFKKLKTLKASATWSTLSKIFPSMLSRGSGAGTAGGLNPNISPFQAADLRDTLSANIQVWESEKTASQLRNQGINNQSFETLMNEATGLTAATATHPRSPVDGLTSSAKLANEAKFIDDLSLLQGKDQTKKNYYLGKMARYAYGKNALRTTIQKDGKPRSKNIGTLRLGVPSGAGKSLKNKGHVPNFAEIEDINRVKSVIQDYIPTEVLTGETLQEPVPLGKTTKRLPTTVFGLRPSTTKNFRAVAGQEYLGAVGKTASRVFGNNYNPAAFKRVTDRVSFPQVRGSMLQDMIGGLAGRSGGAGGGAIDLGPDTLKLIRQRHGERIENAFTPGLFDNLGRRTEIKATLGAVKGTATQSPADLVDKGVRGYLEDQGNIGRTEEERKERERLAKGVRSRIKSLSQGFIPNFATGIFDSDKIKGDRKLKNEILNQILDSGKRIHTFHGAAGTGKTTMASKRFGRNFVLSAADIQKYSDFAVISGAGRSRKTGKISAQTQKIFDKSSNISAVVPTNQEIINRRFNRLDESKASGSPDTRGVSGLRGTLKAPLNDFGIYSDLRKQGKNVELLRNEGFVPNFVEPATVAFGGMAVSAAMAAHEKRASNTLNNMIQKGGPVLSPNFKENAPAEQRAKLGSWAKLGRGSGATTAFTNLQNLFTKDNLKNPRALAKKLKSAYRNKFIVSSAGDYLIDQKLLGTKADSPSLLSLPIKTKSGGLNIPSSKSADGLSKAVAAWTPEKQKLTGGERIRQSRHLVKQYKLDLEEQEQFNNWVKGKPATIKSKPQPHFANVSQKMVWPEPDRRKIANNLTKLYAKTNKGSFKGFSDRAGKFLPTFDEVKAFGRDAVDSATKGFGRLLPKFAKVQADGFIPSFNAERGYGKDSVNDFRKQDKDVELLKSAGFVPSFNAERGYGKGSVNDFRKQDKDVELLKTMGFVPSFNAERGYGKDPVSKAVKTEKAMGGDPVLDFNKRVGLFVRDGKTQKNFGDVLKDHPEGLSSAIKNSRAMQNKVTASAGHVPNFAPFRITDEHIAATQHRDRVLGDTFKPKETNSGQGGGDAGERLDSATGDATTKLLALSFAVPLLTQSVEQFTGEASPKFAAIGTSIGDAVSAFSGVAAVLPGPAGKAVGGILGVGIAASGIAKALQQQGAALAAQAEKSKEAFTKLNNNLSGYASAFSEFNAAAKNANTTAETLIRLREKLDNLLGSIPEDLALEIGSITQADQLQSKIAEVLKKQGQRDIQTQISAGLQVDLDEASGIVSGFVQLIGGASKEFRTVFDGAAGAVKAERLVNDIRKGLNFSGLAEDTGRAAAANRLQSASQNNLVKILGKSYGAASQLQLVLRQLSTRDFEIFRRELIESANAVRRSREAQKEISQRQQELSEQMGIGGQQRSISILTENAKLAADALKKMAGGVEAFLDPDSFKKVFDEFQAGLKIFAQLGGGVGARQPIGQSQQIGLGRGALGLAESVFNIGGIAPQLDTRTGRLDTQNNPLLGQAQAGLEANIRDTISTAIQRLQRELASVQPGSVAAQGIQSSIGQLSGQLDPRIIRRAARTQLADRLGVEEQPARALSIGEAVRDPVTNVARPQTSLGQALEGVGADTEQQIRGAFDNIILQLRNSLEQEQARLRNTQLTPEQQTEASAAEARIQAELVRLQPLQGANTAAIASQDITSLSNLLTSTGQRAISSVGLAGQDGETPAEAALRQAQDNLRISQDNLANEIKLLATQIKNRQNAEDEAERQESRREMSNVLERVQRADLSSNLLSFGMNPGVGDATGVTALRQATREMIEKDQSGLLRAIQEVVADIGGAEIEAGEGNPFLRTLALLPDALQLGEAQDLGATVRVLNKFPEEIQDALNNLPRLLEEAGIDASLDPEDLKNLAKTITTERVQTFRGLLGEDKDVTAKLMKELLIAAADDNKKNVQDLIRTVITNRSGPSQGGSSVGSPIVTNALGPATLKTFQKAASKEASVMGGNKQDVMFDTNPRTGRVESFHSSQGSLENAKRQHTFGQRMRNFRDNYDAMERLRPGFGRPERFDNPYGFSFADMKNDNFPSLRNADDVTGVDIFEHIRESLKRGIGVEPGMEGKKDFQSIHDQTTRAMDGLNKNARVLRTPMRGLAQQHGFLPLQHAKAERERAFEDQLRLHNRFNLADLELSIGHAKNKTAGVAAGIDVSQLDPVDKLLIDGNVFPSQFRDRETGVLRSNSALLEAIKNFSGKNAGKEADEKLNQSIPPAMRGIPGRGPGFSNEFAFSDQFHKTIPGIQQMSGKDVFEHIRKSLQQGVGVESGMENQKDWQSIYDQAARAMDGVRANAEQMRANQGAPVGSIDELLHREAESSQYDLLRRFNLLDKNKGRTQANRTQESVEKFERPIETFTGPKKGGAPVGINGGSAGLTEPGVNPRPRLHYGSQFDLGFSDQFHKIPIIPGVDGTNVLPMALSEAGSEDIFGHIGRSLKKGIGAEPGMLGQNTELLGGWREQAVRVMDRLRANAVQMRENRDAPVGSRESILHQQAESKQYDILRRHGIIATDRGLTQADRTREAIERLDTKQFSFAGPVPSPPSDPTAAVIAAAAEQERRRRLGVRPREDFHLINQLHPEARGADFPLAPIPPAMRGIPGRGAGFSNEFGFSDQFHKTIPGLEQMTGKKVFDNIKKALEQGIAVEPGMQGKKDSTSIYDQATRVMSRVYANAEQMRGNESAPVGSINEVLHREAESKQYDLLRRYGFMDANKGLTRADRTREAINRFDKPIETFTGPKKGGAPVGINEDSAGLTEAVKNRIRNQREQTANETVLKLPGQRPGSSNEFGFSDEFHKTTGVQAMTGKMVFEYIRKNLERGIGVEKGMEGQKDFQSIYDQTARAMDRVRANAKQMRENRGAPIGSPESTLHQQAESRQYDLLRRYGMMSVARFKPQPPQNLSQINSASGIQEAFAGMRESMIDTAGLSEDVKNRIKKQRERETNEKLSQSIPPSMRGIPGRGPGFSNEFGFSDEFHKTTGVQAMTGKMVFEHIRKSLEQGIGVEPGHVGKKDFQSIYDQAARAMDRVRANAEQMRANQGAPVGSLENMLHHDAEHRQYVELRRFNMLGKSRGLSQARRRMEELDSPQIDPVTGMEGLAATLEPMKARLGLNDAVKKHNEHIAALIGQKTGVNFTPLAISHLLSNVGVGSNANQLKISSPVLETGVGIGTLNIGANAQNEQPAANQSIPPSMRGISGRGAGFSNEFGFSDEFHKTTGVQAMTGKMVFEHIRKNLERGMGVEPGMEDKKDFQSIYSQAARAMDRIRANAKQMRENQGAPIGSIDELLHREAESRQYDLLRRFNLMGRNKSLTQAKGRVEVAQVDPAVATNIETNALGPASLRAFQKAAVHEASAMGGSRQDVMFDVNPRTNSFEAFHSSQGSLENAKRQHAYGQRIRNNFKPKAPSRDTRPQTSLLALFEAREKLKQQQQARLTQLRERFIGSGRMGYGIPFGMTAKAGEAAGREAFQRVQTRAATLRGEYGQLSPEQRRLVQQKQAQEFQRFGLTDQQYRQRQQMGTSVEQNQAREQALQQTQQQQADQVRQLAETVASLPEALGAKIGESIGSLFGGRDPATDQGMVFNTSPSINLGTFDPKLSNVMPPGQMVNFTKEVFTAIANEAEKSANPAMKEFAQAIRKNIALLPNI